MNFSLSALVWLALIVIFALIEGATVSLVSIWFAVGAAAALIVSGITQSVLVQVTVFVAVSAAVLAAVRPLIKKHRLDKVPPTNADRNVGRRCTVIVAVTPEMPGRVRLDGVDWSARADASLPVGTLCTVTAVDGATLHVTAEAHAPA